MVKILERVITEFETNLQQTRWYEFKQRRYLRKMIQYHKTKLDRLRLRRGDFNLD